MKTNAFTIYLLALGVFLTATSELVVSGILPRIAEDVNISLAVAGQLIAAYSLSFAIATPLLIVATSRMDRKPLLLCSLAVFIAGSAWSASSSSIESLMAARVVLGASSGMFLVVSLGIAAKLVPADRLGRAIGTIILGFSSAMILGVPLGVAIADWLSWQAIFILLGALAAAVGAVMFRLMPGVEGDEPVPLSRQLKHAGSAVILTAFLISLLREGGNSVFLTYISPYLQQMLEFRTADIAFLMLALGLAGAFASRLGGGLVDRWGAARTLGAFLVLHALGMALLPFFAFSTPVAVGLIAIVFIALFASGPAVQSYMIQQAPKSANLVLSLNTSVIHLGIAGGAGAGGWLINRTAEVEFHPWLAASLIALGFAAALASFALGRRARIRADRRSAA
ncbi:Chloramphenicol resistance protein [Paenibacillus pasadenensis]|uniref:Chloramphenicol resistance protein n=1 Tax=Paenibacillus pasadenensis TaxID=217090 RepID=A0A2N5N4H4_9BACL|nr:MULTISPECIES: MFS transporter [Paenibacillus]PLT45256.1 Chloramphenicol resistance protein [Paenibacillus pasadenensis]QGG55643.1 MFS transporter [Paenibacillus sp. B01]